MKTINNGRWSNEEDRILADTVLRYVSRGRTQLAAFDEVSKTLGRTPSAVGFRWNKTVRHNYENSLQKAREVSMGAYASKPRIQVEHTESPQIMYETRISVEKIGEGYYGIQLREDVLGVIRQVMKDHHASVLGSRISREKAQGIKTLPGVAETTYKDIIDTIDSAIG